MSDDEFDSGDDLFDGVDADDIISSSKRPLAEASGSKTRPNKRTKVDGQATAIAQRLLKDKFGLDGFRHEQEQAISSILSGDNTLVVFPTGAGKSLCYQLPAIAFEELDRLSGENRPAGSGITVVVSPLIALMKDQTDALKRRGIAADTSDSTKTLEQTQQITAEMLAGRLKLLYCAPEKLNNERFVQSMKDVPGGIRLVAVDEAHCISEWGHSFRPDYLKVARFVEEIQAERVICLTATATPRVADDVCAAFKIDKSNVFRTSPYRPNLRLEAEATNDVKEKLPKVVNFLNQHPGSTLVYVTLQKQAEDLASYLRAKGFNAAHFHAGMKTDEKIWVQDQFMASKIPIVVATIAFGMGIDKADIRNIIHYDLSNTVEEYSQQIGRAGRDGIESNCMLYLCHKDFYIRENFARGDLPSRKSLLGLLKEVFSQETTHGPDGEVMRLNQKGLGDTYDIRPSPLSILLATLELRFGLMRAITPEYSKYQFEALDQYNTTATQDSSAEGKAIIKYANKALTRHHLDMKALTDETGLFRNSVIRKLNEWSDRGVIILKVSGVENRYRVLKPLPTKDAEIEEICDKLYVDMEMRETDALARTKQVADLMTGSRCFAVGLAEHFGMGLPGGTKACGHCTFCLTKKPVVLPPKPPVEVDLEGIKKILAVCDVRDDPRFLARIAFGIRSPRVAQLKLGYTGVFGSLEDHEFQVSNHLTVPLVTGCADHSMQSLLNEFTKACESAEYGALATSQPAHKSEPKAKTTKRPSRKLPKTEE